MLENHFSKDEEKNYPKPAVTVDNVILKQNKEKMSLLMIRRKNEPFQYMWALPGGYVDENETVELAAIRELKEETGVESVSMKLVGVFSEPNRDPRGWTISCAYKAIVDDNVLISAGDDATDVEWFVVEWTKQDNQLILNLKHGENELCSVIDVHKGEQGERILGKHQSIGIAFDHAKIIASAILEKWNYLFE